MLPAFYDKSKEPEWNWKEWCFNALYSNLFILSAPGVDGEFFVFDTPALQFSVSPVSLIGLHLISQVVAYN